MYVYIYICCHTPAQRKFILPLGAAAARSFCCRIQRTRSHAHGGQSKKLRLPLQFPTWGARTAIQESQRHLRLRATLLTLLKHLLEHRHQLHWRRSRPRETVRLLQLGTRTAHRPTMKILDHFIMRKFCRGRAGA